MKQVKQRNLIIEILLSNLDYLKNYIHQDLDKIIKIMIIKIKKKKKKKKSLLKEKILNQILMKMKKRKSLLIIGNIKEVDFLLK